jgi:hypothetical protein
MVNKKILQEGFRNWLLDTQTIKCGGLSYRMVTPLRQP